MRGGARAVARRILRRPRIVYRAAGRPRAVALTFDDGPSPWTARIASALHAHRCQGTFFVNGAAAERDPQTLAELADAGHELGNHLWSHSDPATQDVRALRAEIDRTAAAVRDATGVSPALVRPPYCGAPSRVARAASGRGVSLVVLRSIDPADWKAGSAEEILDEILGVIEPGDIVCLHDGIPPKSRGTRTREATVKAVNELVPALIDRDLQPVTVSRLLA